MNTNEINGERINAFALLFNTETESKHYYKKFQKETITEVYRNGNFVLFPFDSYLSTSTPQ